MEKLNLKNYNLSYLTLSTPTKYPNGYNIKILYRGKAFAIQSPVCEVEEISFESGKQYVKVSFQISKNFNHFQFFCCLDQQIIEALENHKMGQQYDILTSTKGNVEDNFSSSTEKVSDSVMTLHVKLNNETCYFNRESNEMSKLEINVGDKIIMLMHNKGIFTDSHYANLRWTALQVMKWK